MSLVDVFFTPSLFITLAVCLILISLLGLYFIQKINQQNHKINTMVDLVATLGEQMNTLRAVHLPNNLSAGGSSLDTSNTPISQNQSQHEIDRSDTHTVNMIHVSDNEENEDSEVEYDEDNEDDDEEDDSNDEEEDSDDEEEDSDDEEEDDEEIDSDDEIEDVEEIVQDKSKDLELPELTTDDIDETLMIKKASIETIEVEQIPELEPDVILEQDDESETGVKSLDIVLDYKKASLSKLRDIVQSKGLVTDASKMKKSDILKVLESQ